MDEAGANRLVGVGILVILSVIARTLPELYPSTRKWWFYTNKKSEKKLNVAPGFMMLRWADTLLSSKTFERVVQPIIADMQWEYLEALARAEQASRLGEEEEYKRQNLRAVLIRGRGFLNVVSALGLNILWSTIKSVFRLWKA